MRAAHDRRRMTRTIDLVYFDAGGGHRAAALALRDVIARQRRPWTVRLVNLSEVLDPGCRWRRAIGIDPEALYNGRLRRGWTLGLRHELRLLQAGIRLAHGPIVEALQQHWLRTEPDLVASLVPNFNRALYESVASTLPGVPFTTVLTDMEDLPPHFWIETGQHQHVVCGSPAALAQARAAGYPDGRLSLTSGMILHPGFYRAAREDRRAGLRALGLDPDRPTGLVTFGGQGSARMVDIARLLSDHQLLLLCGRNDALVGKLNRMQRGAPHAALGFTSEMPQLMALCDYFIGKPGPASLSEAVHCGLPVITFLNAWTMPQERANTRWVLTHGIGRVVSAMKALPSAVDEVLADLDALQPRVRAIDNRAVFEVPEIFEALLMRAAVPAVRRTEFIPAASEQTP
jgi:hypothetical protein